VPSTALLDKAASSTPRGIVSRRKRLMMPLTTAWSSVQEPIFCKISRISRIFRQQTPVQSDIFRRALLKEDQGITDVVGLIDGGSDLFEHFLLGI
jgi:hypothetical protein